MKKLLIAFCCAFTAVTLFCSFNAKEVKRIRSMGEVLPHGTYHTALLTIDGQDYIVVQSSEGIGICKK